MFALAYEFAVVDGSKHIANRELLPTAAYLIGMSVFLVLTLYIGLTAPAEAYNPNNTHPHKLFFMLFFASSGSSQIICMARIIKGYFGGNASKIKNSIIFWFGFVHIFTIGWTALLIYFLDFYNPLCYYYA